VPQIPAPAHVDHHLARPGDRHGDALDARRLGAVDDQGAHQASHRGASIIIRPDMPVAFRIDA